MNVPLVELVEDDGANARELRIDQRVLALDTSSNRTW
jgi:hypothetical protein